MAHQEIPCSITGCNRLAFSRGFCRTHYNRWNKYGNALAGLQPEPTSDFVFSICSIDGCEKAATSGNGFCGTHYARWRRHGDPLGGKHNTSPGDAEAWLQDHASFEGKECLIWPFARQQSGLPERLMINRKRYGAHRRMCEIVNGPPPTSNHVTAHNCGKGHLGCVNPNHLRWATQLENEADKALHGTIKLNEEKVRQIRNMPKTMTHESIANAYGVSRSNITNILNGKIWQWVK